MTDTFQLAELRGVRTQRTVKFLSTSIIYFYSVREIDTHTHVDPALVTLCTFRLLFSMSDVAFDGNGEDEVHSSAMLRSTEVDEEFASYAVFTTHPLGEGGQTSSMSMEDQHLVEHHNSTEVHSSHDRHYDPNNSMLTSPASRGESPVAACDESASPPSQTTRSQSQNATPYQRRDRSATTVMAYQRNQDPNASPPRVTSAASSPDRADGTRRMFSMGAVQIKAASVMDVIQKAAGDAQTQELLAEIHRPYISDVSMPPSSKKKKLPPTSLPAQLKLPMVLRCELCQRLDSVCSNCHFKWRGIAESRKAVFTASFSSLPEHRRIPLFFHSVAYGHAALVAAILDTVNAGRVSELQYNFTPVAGTIKDPAVAATLAKAGAVSLLHVACALQRLDTAKLLLNRGARFRNSEFKVTPHHLLPVPLPDDWQEMLEGFPVYEEFTMVERAKRLRNEKQFEAALLEYQAVIKVNPYSEMARCGIAKTMFDQGDLEECIRACDSVLLDQREIQWLEHVPESVALLRSEAIRALHEKCHLDTSTALRRCGCVIVDPVHHRISIRRLPFRLLTEKVLAYCDCATLWAVWQATSVPLLQSATERIASKHSLDTVGTMLTGEFGYAEMYEAIRADEPPISGKNALLKPPLRFLGVHVAVMADFHTFLMRASVVGGNPKYSTDSFFSFGKKSEETKRPRIVATKCFRVYRAGVGKAWEIGDGGEWEIDGPASDALLNAVQERMKKT